MQATTQLIPNNKLQTVIICIFVLGTMTAIVLAIGALIAAIYAVLLLMDATGELFSHIAAVYSAGDPLTKLIMWLVLLLIVTKAARPVARYLKKSLKF